MPSCMPPPAHPPTHRRSRHHTHTNLPPSPPCSPDTSPCGHRKMSLSKGATFHVPSSPPAEDDPVLSIQHLARRSPTSSHLSLLSLIFDKEGVAERSIKDFEHTFSGARGRRLSGHRRRSCGLDQSLKGTNHTLPSDEGLGSSISGCSEKGLVRSLGRALDLVSDSGLGTSIGDGSVKRGLAAAGESLEGDPENDGLSVEDLIQDPSRRSTLSLRARQQGSSPRLASSSAGRSAVTQSISPQLPTSRTRQRPLGVVARTTLAKNIIDPILREDRFKPFHPLVTSLRSKNNTSIKCLRDLERSLIFEPLVSQYSDLDHRPTTYHLGLPLKALSISRQLYRTFGEFSIQLVVDTYNHLSEPEQRRASDRPYDNGYFLDLVQQVGQLAAQIGRDRQARSSGEEVDQDEMTYSPDDEVTLEGGLGETGDVAELVRWKNGKGTSLRTNEPYEPLPGFKRERSCASMDDDDDDDVARSMARRKKGAEYKVIELKCSDPTCDKSFTRKCDLAKHEKTHSRPFKCPEPSCKYHEQGLPTEKEKERHINDKHSDNPRFYHCSFCPFKTKRDSNCKQHMEKKHGWKYDRVKGNSKVVRTPAQTPQTPNMEYSPTTASVAPSYVGWSESSATGSVAGSRMVTPLDQPMPDFGSYSPAPTVPYALFPRDQTYATPNNVPDLGTINQGFITHQPSAVGPVFPHPSEVSPFTPVTPITSHGSAAPSLGPSPYASYDIDIDFTSPLRHMGIHIPTSNHLQPTSHNPSISYVSPLRHPSADYFFVDPQEPQLLHELNLGDNGMLPVDDFPLFEGVAHHQAYPADTGASTADVDLFPNMSYMDYAQGDDGTTGMDDFINMN